LPDASQALSRKPRSRACESYNRFEPAGDALMVTCTVREIRRAGGRRISAVARDPEGAAMLNEVVELPMDETGLADHDGQRPSGVSRPSARS
jgi:hypothetical protein